MTTVPAPHTVSFHIVTSCLSTRFAQIVVSARSAAGGCWQELGRTEQSKAANRVNIGFIQSVSASAADPTIMIKFAVYDVKKEGADISEQKFLGDAEEQLGKIIAVGSGSSTEELIGLQLQKDGKNVSGSLLIIPELLGIPSYQISFEIVGRNLDKKDVFGKSDPYFEVLKHVNKNQSIVVYHSETVMKNLDPDWDPFSVNDQQLCGGDPNRQISIRVYDWNKSGIPDWIGDAVTTFAALSEPGEITLELVNPNLFARRNNYKNSGVVIIKKHEVAPLAAPAPYTPIY